MYCDKVARAPRGPAPPLLNKGLQGPFLWHSPQHAPNNAPRAKDEANGQTDARAHHSTHPKGI